MQIGDWVMDILHDIFHHYLQQAGVMSVVVLRIGKVQLPKVKNTQSESHKTCASCVHIFDNSVNCGNPHKLRERGRVCVFVCLVGVLFCMNVCV